MKFKFQSPSKPLEPGIHVGVVIDAEETISSSGHDQIIVHLKFEGGMKIMDRLTASEKAYWRLSQAYTAFGFEADEGDVINLNPGQLIGNSVAVRIDRSKPRDDGKTFLEVVEYIAHPDVPV